jgi:hypothetical protein
VTTKGHARRFAVAAIGGEGVVLDTTSGEIYRAGATALVVFRALARGSDVAGAAGALVQAFAVSRARAERDVRAILASLSGAPRREGAGAREAQFRAAVRGGYEMQLDGVRVVSLDERGRTVERTAMNADVLRLVAPHVLALAGERVLHASAVLVGGEVVAFVAPSGTGKTTLARLLEGEGVRVISEDLLVLRDAREAVLGGERTLRTWSRSRALTVSTTAVLASVEGRTKALGAVVVLERRAGQRRFALEALRGADAIMALFANAFVEVPSPRVWRKALATCRSIAARDVVYRACVPDGLDALARTLAAAAARRRLARASDAYDPVEALLGVRRPDPRMTDAVMP